VPWRTKVQLRAQKLLTPHGMLAGKIVDTEITAALHSYRQYGVWPDDLVERGLQRLEESITESQRFARRVTDNPEQWPRETMNPAVDRIFFDMWTADDEIRAAEKIRASLENFLTEEIQHSLTPHVGEEWWMPTKPFPWFRASRMPVYAVWDFVVRTADGRCLIFDWKTSDPDQYNAREKAIRQLHCYAAFAKSRWNYTNDKISLFAVWVRMGTVEHYTVDPDELKALGAYLRSHYSSLEASYWSARNDLQNVLDYFPVVEDVECCSRCRYHACDGRQRIGTEDEKQVGSDYEDWDPLVE